MKIVEVNSLTKSFGSHTAINNLSFSIEEGSCTALIGPNGAGKTTTLDMIAGLLDPTNGSISFLGNEGADYRKHIGYLPQQPVFFPWMNALEYLQFMGELFGTHPKKVSDKANELLLIVGISDAKKRRIGEYSGGMKQRLGIAQALIHEPRLLILDEPVSALDPVGRREVLEMMKLLKEKMTILFSTHILHDAEEVCNDVIMIHKGELAIAGPLTDLRRKHQQDVITITADENIEGWAKSLDSWDSITRVIVNNETVKIFVRDAAMIRNRLIAEMAEKNLPVSSFTVGHTSLEDLFMEVVGK